MAKKSPIEALEKLGKGKLSGKSIKQLKKESREKIEKHALKKLAQLESAIKEDIQWAFMENSL